MATPDRIDDEADVHAQEATDRPELGPVLTPGKIFGGFALLAALILLLRRRRPREREGDD